MSKSNEEDSPESVLGIQPLQVPVFQSRIPQSMIDSLTPRDREVLVTMSIMAQQQDWIASVVLQHNKYLREIEARQSRFERWRLILVNKWTPFIYLGMTVLPFVLSKLLDKFFK